MIVGLIIYESKIPPAMAKAKKEEAKTQDTIDYSAEIDKLRDTEPHKNTNKYIEGLINEAVVKTKKEAYSSGFWNGLVLGIILAFILWTVTNF